jgi:hypothetical protein
VRESAIIVVVAVSMTSADMGQLEKYPIAGLISKPLTADKLMPHLAAALQRRGRLGCSFFVFLITKKPRWQQRGFFVKLL